MSSEHPHADKTERPPGADLRPLRQLAHYVAPYRATLAAAIIALLLAAAATLSLPVAVRLMIDHGFDDAGAVDRYFLVLLALSLFMAATAAIRHYLVSWLGQRVVTDIRSDVYSQVLHLDPVFFETTRTGEVLSRLTTDTTLIDTVIGSTVSIALRSAVMLAGALIMLVVTAPKLAMIILLLLPFVVLPIVGYARRVRGLSRTSQDRIADASARAGETLNAMQTVQAFTQEESEAKRFTASVESAFQAAMGHARARAVLSAMSIMLVFAGIVSVLWLGARNVIDGSMTAGELGQFVLYAATMASSTAMLSDVWGDMQRAAGATERLVELLNATPEIAAPANTLDLPQPPRGVVALNHVSFSYPSRPDELALNDFTLRITTGETVALVGPSGAGKSTVFQLLLRFYDPQRGHIAVDGVDISKVDPVALRRRLGIVPQDTIIFAASAMDNIRYGRPEASDEEVRAAARNALCDEFLVKLPEGFDTYLGERGVRLSGGQRQRIAIARAILKDPPILLLDEATSSLDAASERVVQEALGRLVRDRTTLVIAHRFSTVLRADRIVVMDEGRIVDEGSHEQLQRRDGLYARLAALQFSDDAA
ncbi:MAG: ATP-binding cassette domain-containing protein [Gammaproteobacteria bacterium]|nr:ATP-binding cassette domain-containing protein [Gammaproteobacteria bacterium]NNF61208.1 ATP-binding cassette domain-containing protein [Gammaproteobacteria bacterium]